MKYTEDRTRRAGEEGEKNAGNNTVIVGMKMGTASRELLTWALVKVAHAGDRVIALHVIPSVQDSFENTSSLISSVDAFDDVLNDYEGFCKLKQIDLELKLCCGTSIRRVLVQEVRSASASKLVLGVTRDNRVVGSSSSCIAKYCTKRVSPGCLVLAVNNGRVVFKKESTGRQIFHKSDPMKLQKFNAQAWKNAIPSHSLEPTDEAICDSLRDFVISENDKNSFEDGTKRSLSVLPKKETESSFGCVSMLTRELPVARPGWSLLRKAVLTRKGKSALTKSKSSLFQWTLRLRSWNSASSLVRANRKKSDESAKCNFEAGIDDEKETFIELLSLLDEHSLIRLFTYKELNQATSNFSPANIIGKGGSSMVYRGFLSNGKEIAIKILNPSQAMLKYFISEIEIIAKLHHKNITTLFGFCFEKNHFILVYEFLSRGSLEDNLHGIKGMKNDLGWAERYKIAVGVAEALNYLHNSSGIQCVIHRDVKSSNILLSDDFEPQLSDFGLAQRASSSLQSDDGIMDCSSLAGTVGYLAPEYFMYGKIDEKIDVYAFGVVLLELISGKRPVSTGCPKGEKSLTSWARPILHDSKFEQLVDPFLADNYNRDEMERLSLSAALCIRKANNSRPLASLVLKLLQGDMEAIGWAKSELNSTMESPDIDDESRINIQSHINLALLDIEDDAISSSSVDHSESFVTTSIPLEEYLKARCSP